MAPSTCVIEDQGRATSGAHLWERWQPRLPAKCEPADRDREGPGGPLTPACLKGVGCAPSSRRLPGFSCGRWGCQSSTWAELVPEAGMGHVAAGRSRRRGETHSAGGGDPGEQPRRAVNGDPGLSTRGREAELNGLPQGKAGAPAAVSARLQPAVPFPPHGPNGEHRSDFRRAAAPRPWAPAQLLRPPEGDAPTDSAGRGCVDETRTVPRVCTNRGCLSEPKWPGPVTRR